MILTGENKVTR